MKSDEYEGYDNLFPDIHNSLSFGNACSLCKQCYNFIGQDIIWGNGPRNASIMVVGEDSAGGKPNERLWKGSRCTGIPLTNKKSGAKIRILLKKAGIDPHEVFFTNAVKCNTGNDKYKLEYKDLVPCCIKHLLKEIRKIKPDVIICLGKDAHKVVYDRVEEAGVNRENCEYLEHPCRVEGPEREPKYIEKIKQIIEKRHKNG